MCARHIAAFVCGVALALVVTSAYLLAVGEAPVGTTQGTARGDAGARAPRWGREGGTMDKGGSRKAHPARRKRPTPKRKAAETAHAPPAKPAKPSAGVETTDASTAPATGQVERRPRNFMADLNAWVLGEWSGDEFVPKYVTRCESGLWEHPTANRYFRTRLRYRMFTADEAQACLVGKKVTIVGDSYMRGMYIGMVDVVRGNTTHQSRHVHTSKALSKMPYTYNLADMKNDTFAVGHTTQQNAFLDTPPLMKRLLDNDDKVLEHDFVAMNTLIHEVKFRTVQKLKNAPDTRILQMLVAKIVQYVKHLLEKKPSLKFVWVTGTGYKLDLVPRGYREHQTNKRMLWYNTGIVKALRKLNVGFLDIFHMTETCRESRCFDGHKGDQSLKNIDGSHKSRFVNRMKAQMLLNYMCPPPVDETYETTKPLSPRSSEVRRIVQYHKFEEERKVNGFKDFKIPRA